MQEGYVMKPALLVIDMQKQFYNRGGLFAQSFNQVIPHINTAIALFREKNMPIISSSSTRMKQTVWFRGQRVFRPMKAFN
jgi:nicotinamidase-related amidase